MSIILSRLNTEKRNENSMHIDEMSTIEMLETINNEDQIVALAVKKVLPQVASLVDAIRERMKQGGRVIYIGAGTSGRLGVLDASECPPTFGVPSTLIQGIIAGGYEALLKAKEGAEDSLTLASEDLKNINLSSKDTVIGLAASGRTPYVIGGLMYAKKVGALRGSISCVEDSEITKYSEYPIEVLVGAEVISGSTRMKAGTSQKLILNMISTSLMIKYGKVYQNLMVDVQPSNDKLVVRAIAIICEASGCSDEEAKKYLHESKQNVKVAICMAITKKSSDECQQILDTFDGNVSKAIHHLLK